MHARKATMVKQCQRARGRETLRVAGRMDEIKEVAPSVDQEHAIGNIFRKKEKRREEGTGRKKKQQRQHDEKMPCEIFKVGGRFVSEQYLLYCTRAFR